MPVTALDLPEHEIKRLHSKGFVYCDDLEVGLKRNVPVMKSALDLLQEEYFSSNIVTFCKELDDVLGGGVATKSITEFNGLPGSGKTQIW